MKSIVFHFFDKVGISVSFLCAIHCTILPIIFPLLSLSGIAFIWDPFFEFSMIAIALVVGIPSLLLSYYKVHRNKMPLILFISGILLLVLFKAVHLSHGFNHTHIISTIDWIIILSAAGLIISGHYFNFRLSRTCPALLKQIKKGEYEFRKP